MIKYLTALTCLFLTFPAAAQEVLTESATTPELMQLYRMNCGEIHVSDLNAFSDTEQYTGKDKSLVASCYLIKKGEKLILWDTGLPPAVAEQPEGIKSGVFTLKQPYTLVGQLETLGIKPEDITHIGISHAHFDHTGGASLFKNATLILQKGEYDFLTAHSEDAKRHHADPSALEYFLKPENKDHLRLLNGDEDLFDDGTLKAITLPGHTPGHMALKVTLPKNGVVILSGDQWHFHENRTHNGVPGFNVNRAETLASSDKLNKLVKNTNAKLILQHEANDVNIIPALPGFMD